MQQSYAKVAGVVESVDVTQTRGRRAPRSTPLALQRHGVRVLREFEALPPILTEKHKVLQILVNLIRNAKYALDDSEQPDKLLTIRVGRRRRRPREDSGRRQRRRHRPENLTRIFAHGFTTRRNGHGFGLHSSALAVRELGGSLHAHSDGAGKGATLHPGAAPAAATLMTRMNPPLPASDSAHPDRR